VVSRLRWRRRVRAQDRVDDLVDEGLVDGLAGDQQTRPQWADQELDDDALIDIRMQVVATSRPGARLAALRAAAKRTRTDRHAREGLL
jgi:hypothetical protein